MEVWRSTWNDLGRGGMCWSSKNNNNSSKGGSTVARIFVRMISSPCNLIKRYYYDVDRPTWAFVMMIIIVESHSAFIEF